MKHNKKNIPDTRNNTVKQPPRPGQQPAVDDLEEQDLDQDTDKSLLDELDLEDDDLNEEDLDAIDWDEQAEDNDPDEDKDR